MKTWAALLQTDKQPAAAILRIALGAIILPHGAQHFLGWFGGYGFGGTLKWMTQDLGFPAPLAALAITTELLAPIALIVGIGARVAALGIAGIMLGAIFTHVPNGFFMNWFGSLPAGAEGFEYHLLVTAMALTIMVQGGGALSLDRVLVNRTPRAASFTKLGLFALSLLLTACSDDVDGPAHEVPVASVTVQPDTLTLIVGQTQRLQARVVDYEGDVVHGQRISWSSDNNAAATVDSTGRVTTVQPGLAYISAATAGRAGIARVRVIAEPQDSLPPDTVTSWTKYRLINMPIKIREYELPPTANYQVFRKLLLVHSEFRLSTDERSYEQRFSVEIWETQRFADGSSITSFIETVTTDDFGAAGTIAGVGDFFFQSMRTGARFTGNRTATSFGLQQSVPGAIETFTLTFMRDQ
jgi:putative oxidoreductase